MQLRPGENFTVVRQLDDPYDSGTYYVRASIRDAQSDELIAVLDLDDRGDQRFAKSWQVVEDPSGLGRYIDVETLVYTDSGYSSVSEQYRRENKVYLVEERVTNLGGGGADINYEKIRKIFVENKPKNPGPVSFAGVLKAISELDKSIKANKPDSLVKSSQDAILREIDALSSAIKDVNDAISQKVEEIGQRVDGVGQKVDSIEPTDLSPITDQLDKFDIGNLEKINKSFVDTVRDIFTSDSEKTATGIGQIIKILKAIPFIVMHGGQKMEKSEPVEEEPKKPSRMRSIRSRGFIDAGLLLTLVAVSGLFLGGLSIIKNYQPEKSQETVLGDTVGTIEQWKAETSGGTTTITQRISGRQVRLSGYDEGCVEFDSNGRITSTGVACGTGSGGGGATTTINGVLGPNFSFTSSSTALSYATSSGNIRINLSTSTLQSLLTGTSTQLWLPNGSNIYNAFGGNVGIGTSSPSAPLHIIAQSASGVRETLLKAGASDAPSNMFFGIANGTSVNNQFLSSFYGIAEGRTDAYSLNFTGFVSSSSDTSDSSNFGIVDIAAFRTSDTNDPFNGTLSNVSNRKIFSVRNNNTVLMAVTAAGNVGIGLNPSHVLDVKSATATATFRIQTTGGRNLTITPSDDGNLDLTSNSTLFGFNFNGVYTGGSARHKFQFNGTDAFVMTPTKIYSPSLYLAMGSSSVAPAYRIHVMGENDYPGTTIAVQRSFGDNTPPSFLGVKSRGSLASPTAVLSGDQLIRWLGAGYYNTSSNNNSGAMYFAASENWSATNMGASFGIDLTANGTTTRTNVFNILGDGKVGIGTTTPLARLSVNSNSANFTPLTIGSNSTFVANFADNINDVSGVQMGNTSTGTGADFRFLIKDTTNHYFAFSQPGVNNSAAALLGQARNSTDYIFNAGGTTRNLTIGTTDAKDLIFGTNNAERFRILSNGNVGIGTTSPSSLLTVATSGSGFQVNGSGTVTSGTWNGSAIDISSYTNLSAGRSLTLSGDSVEADAELYTEIKTATLISPTTTDDALVQFKFPTAVTITRVSCSTDVGTTTIQFDERAEATPNSAGTDVMTGALDCTTTTGVTTSFSNAGVAANAPMSLDIDAVAGSSAVVRINVEYTKDD